MLELKYRLAVAKRALDRSIGDEHTRSALQITISVLEDVITLMQREKESAKA